MRLAVPRAGAALLAKHGVRRRDERGGRRRVHEIVAVTGALGAEGPESVPLFALEGGELRVTGEVPPRAAKFARGGVDPAVILRRHA